MNTRTTKEEKEKIKAADTHITKQSLINIAWATFKKAAKGKDVSPTSLNASRQILQKYGELDTEQSDSGPSAYDLMTPRMLEARILEAARIIHAEDSVQPQPGEFRGNQYSVPVPAEDLPPVV